MAAEAAGRQRSMPHHLHLLQADMVGTAPIASPNSAITVPRPVFPTGVLPGAPQGHSH